MEILSYVVDGEITLADSMDNQQRISRGQVQYMSAGTGITHSEHNRRDEMLAFFKFGSFLIKLDIHLIMVIIALTLKSAGMSG